MVKTITKVIARSGQEAALRALMVEVAELARQEEGCLRYDLWQGQPIPQEFVTIGEWESKEAFQTHLRSPYIDEFMMELPVLVRPSPRYPVVRFGTLIPSPTWLPPIWQGECHSLLRFGLF
ncbi:MAG: antibiotic biosynthesis monooxygenase [Leptolyngbyaceae cyanobacterium SM2_3_12]|nr:antibiotic biosynthesis monooxygenase [Leptolyngbyaceae cyanobacterium SM2_3_12]